jgi:tetratricopeptide (TPR) repeat protein
MSRYRCANCEITFEAEPCGPPRCPECLRQHGIEEIGAGGPKRTDAKRGRRRWLLPALVATVVIVGAGGGLLLYRRTTALPGPGELGVLDGALLRRTLLHRGVASEDVVIPFAADKSIRELASSTKGSTPKEIAAKVAARLSRLLQTAGARVDLDGTGQPLVRNAMKLHRALVAAEKNPPAGVKDRQPVTASPLELAVLAVSALRAAGLQAVLCQVARIKAKVRTAEISGGVGRYVAAVYPEGGLGQKPLAVLDPARALELPAWAGGGGDPTMRSLHEKLEPLDDGTAAAHLLALRALRLRTREPDQAFNLSEMAIKAAAPSATLLLIRAKVLAAAGGTKDAAREAQKALSLRDGPPQRTLLGLALAGEGSVGPAISHLEQALAADPSYWPAHQALATLLMGDKRGKKVLEAGLAIAPNVPGLLLLRATWLLAEDKPDEATVVLERIASRSNDPHALLLLYQALVKAGNAERARAIRERLVKSAGSERERIEKLLSAVDSAARDVDTPPPATAPPAGGGPKLKLPDVSLTR